MADLPPPGSRRLTLAMIFWAFFSIVFVGLFTYRGIVWLRTGGEFPILATIGGFLGLIGVWRWIVAARRDHAPDL